MVSGWSCFIGVENLHPSVAPAGSVPCRPCCTVTCSKGVPFSGESVLAGRRVGVVFVALVSVLDPPELCVSGT